MSSEAGTESPLERLQFAGLFRAADEEGVSPAVAADRLAEERMRSVGRLATIRLPH